MSEIVEVSSPGAIIYTLSDDDKRWFSKLILSAARLIAEATNGIDVSLDVDRLAEFALDKKRVGFHYMKAVCIARVHCQL